MFTIPMKVFRILIVLLFFAIDSKAQNTCLPDDKATLAQIDLYIKELQRDTVKFNAFIEKVLQHPQYASVIEPIIARVSEQLLRQENTTQDIKTYVTAGDWNQVREIVCSLLPTMIEASARAATATGASVPLAKIWFAMDNHEYSNGDVIEISYMSNDKHLAFSLKHYPANTETFQWAYVENDVDITALVKNSEPNVDNFGINIRERNGNTKLKVKYGNSEVTVQLKIVKEPFNLIKLTAHPEGNLRRLATAGQTLYMVDGNLTTGIAKIVYNAVFNPELDPMKYAPSDIVWKYSDQTQYRYEQLEIGKKEITRSLKEDEVTLKTSIEGGYPDKTIESVDVKWVDGSIKSFSFVPPATSAVLTKTFKQVGDNLEILDKVIPVGGKGIKVEPIKITGRKFNVADGNSRLYKEMEVGFITGGITYSLLEKKFTPPVFVILERAGVADIGVYIKIELGVFLNGGVERFKFVENNNYQGTNPYIEFQPRGCIEAGVKANLLVAKDLVDFEVKGYTQACLVGSLKYEFENEEFKGKVSLPPVIVGGKIKIKTKGTLNFELVDWNGSVSISEEVKLFPW